MLMDSYLVFYCIFVNIKQPGLYVSGFAKRDHLGRTSDFELGIWRESTSDELPFALYCAALACSVAEICLRKAWNDKKYVFEKTAQNIYFR